MGASGGQHHQPVAVPLQDGRRLRVLDGALHDREHPQLHGHGVDQRYGVHLPGPRQHRHRQQPCTGRLLGRVECDPGGVPHLVLRDPDGGHRGRQALSRLWPDGPDSPDKGHTGYKRSYTGNPGSYGSLSLESRVFVYRDKTYTIRAIRHTGAAVQVRFENSDNRYGAWTDITGDNSTTSYTVTGLTNGTEYTFQVRAFTSGGGGDASNEASATPLAGAFFSAFLTAGGMSNVGYSEGNNFGSLSPNDFTYSSVNRTVYYLQCRRMRRPVSSSISALPHTIFPTTTAPPGTSQARSRPVPSPPARPTRSR